MKQVKAFIPNDGVWNNTEMEILEDKVNTFCKKYRVLNIDSKIIVGMDNAPMLGYVVMYEVAE